MEKIERTELGSAIRDSMMMMSIEAVTNRALPFLVDGFKPSQRKALYTMKIMGLQNKLAKSANIEGQNMKISPHSGAYNTLVRMTREKEVLLTPFINGKGSFGKVYSSTMDAAAARYTEMQLAPICKEMLDTLHKHPNNMKDNYDGTMKEPIFLSLPFPNILANPQDGIGIGYACSFPSFNLAELCDACIAYLEDRKDEIYSLMPGPDFTTGGQLLYDKEIIKQIYETGSGSVRIRANIKNDEENNLLEILEIPYSTTAERIITSIQKEYDKGKFPEIQDVIDEIGIDGFKVSVAYKKGTDVDQLIDKLYVLTPLQDYFSCNMTLVHNMRPKTLGVFDIIDKWIEHRKEWIQEELDFDIAEKEHRKMLLEGLAKILLDIDKAVQIVKDSKNDDEVLEGLKLTFELNDEQAEHVANIKLRNFNQDYILNKTSEIDKLANEITKLKNTDVVVKMIDDLKRIKETYGIPRKTEIVKDWEHIELKAPVKKKKEIKGKSVVFTGLNTIRRMQENTTAKTNEGHIRHEVDNKDEILIFTSHHKVFKIRVHKIKMGTLLDAESLLRKNDLDYGETIIYVTPLKPENDMFIVFDNGKAARFSQEAYLTEGNRHVIKRGYNSKAVAIHIEALDEDKIIHVPGYKPIDTSKFMQKKSRLIAGNRVPKEK